MERELRMYNSYSNNVIFFLKVAGLWPETHPILKRILSVVSLCSIFMVMVTVTNFSFKNVGNVMILTRGMSVAVSFSSALSKVLMFLLYRNDLVYLNKHLTGSFMRDIEESKNYPDLLNNVKTFNRFMRTHAASVGLTAIMYIIGPLIAIRKYGKYVSVYPAIYPFTFKPGGLVYWFLYAAEVAGALTLWTVTIGVDCVFGVYSLQMCGELRILAQKFRELKSAEKYHDKLKDCIRRHHILIHAKNKLQNAFGLISIWMAISGALVVCSLIFQVTELLKTNTSYLRAVHLSVYLLPKFLQIFSYAWYGDLIAEESAVCLDAMYYSLWPDSSDKNFKKDVLIVLTQEPLVLVAMGCMAIQLEMFMKILNTSVSYFFLLRTLNEDNV